MENGGTEVNGYKSPCYKCTDRKVGCHDLCEKPERLKYLQRLEGIRSNRKKERYHNNQITANEKARFTKAYIDW